MQHTVCFYTLLVIKFAMPSAVWCRCINNNIFWVLFRRQTRKANGERPFLLLVTWKVCSTWPLAPLLRRPGVIPAQPPVNIVGNISVASRRELPRRILGADTGHAVEDELVIWRWFFTAIRCVELFTVLCWQALTVELRSTYVWPAYDIHLVIILLGENILLKSITQ